MQIFFDGDSLDRSSSSFVIFAHLGDFRYHNVSHFFGHAMEKDALFGFLNDGIVLTDWSMSGIMSPILFDIHGERQNVSLEVSVGFGDTETTFLCCDILNILYVCIQWIDEWSAATVRLILDR